MKKTLLLCALFSLPALAGPVGRYLGLRLGRTAVFAHVGRDSFHYIFGGDSIFDRAYTDTTRVVAETVYAGAPAWLVRRITVRNGVPSASVDTLVESGDTLLRARVSLLFASQWANQHRVPFDSGRAWPMGLAGTYIGEFTGDTIIDTLTVWADTARVAGRETVTVPAGTFADCARIERRLRQRFATTVDTLRVLESAYVRLTEWYKDSLCPVKDTTVATGRIYTRFLIWIPVADFVSWDIGRLTDISVALAEAAPSRPPARVTATPNPFRSSTTLQCQPAIATRHSSLYLYDASGRLILSRPLADPAGHRHSSAFFLDLAILPSGTYFAVFPGQRPLALVKTN